MLENAKKPSIRFVGFTDPWEQRKLSDCASFCKGSGYSKADLKTSGTPIILYGRLYTAYKSEISSVDTFANIRPGSYLSNGTEVVVPASGETAEEIARASAVTIKNCILGGDLNIVIPEVSMDSVFLAISISNGYVAKELAKRAQGKSVVHIHNSDLQELTIPFPSIEEQILIKNYLGAIDNLITLHQRECFLT